MRSKPLLTQSDVDIDLTAAAEKFPDVFDGLEAPRNATASAVMQYAEEARMRVVRRIGVQVKRNPAAALTWWLGMLENIYDIDKELHFSPLPVLAIQQVYIHFLGQCFAVPIFQEPVPLQPFWEVEILELVHLWQRLSMALQEARLGNEFQLSAGHLCLAPTEISSWAGEINANIRAVADQTQRLVFTPLDDYRDRMACEAERRVFGISVTDALTQLGNVERLSGITRLQLREDWLLLVDLGGQIPPQLEQLFRRFMLNRRRLSQQLAPDFLIAPEAPILRSFPAAITESAEYDWLAYAPVMLGTYGDHIPVAIISRYLLYRARVKTRTGIARRLVVAKNEAKRSSPADVPAIGALSRDVHTALEVAAATCFRAADMAVVQNLENINGRPLKCGEIDVLAATSQSEWRPVVVVCEVKDTDLHFYKDRGPDEAYNVSKKGRGQVQKKANWVAAHWNEVRGALDPAPAFDASEAYFVALVVPRAASLPIGPGPASVGLPELVGVARALTETPFEAWRPDLKRAVVQ